MKLPKKCDVVIIGGGVSGCSVAYHLSELGWNNIALIERKKLTSGTTWHAAGLISQLRANLNMTRLAQYSAELYHELEEKTKISTGIKRNGSLTLALSSEREEEILRQLSLAKVFNVEAQSVSKKEIQDIYPGLNMEDIHSGVFVKNDGQADPSNITMALAKGARMNGVEIFEDTKIEKVISSSGEVSGVKIIDINGEKIEIKTKIVINCAGMWSRELAKKNKINIPLHACEHFYIVTEPISGLEQLPVLRVPDECAYYKEDAGKILLGAFEPEAKPWGMNGIPEDFCFDQLPDDFEHFEPILEKAINRFPLLKEVGIHTFFNGPESFTPDDKYYLGEVPELKGYWVACGYNSVGIVSSGGAGMVLAKWITDGFPPFDIWDVDIRRVHYFQKNRKYLKTRVSETLGLLYADHFPHRQMKTCRGIKKSPIHELLKKRGAVFGESAGYERANWFAFKNQKAEYTYSWKRQNWFENQKVEHLAIRNNVGLFDMSSFGKIIITGKEALTFLQKVCCSQMDVPVGKIVYTQMLNNKGGIECDLTVSRLETNLFLLIVPLFTIQRDLFWLKKNKEDFDVLIMDYSSSESVLCLMGPNSRKVLEKCSPNDFSNGSHPFGRWKEIEIGMTVARAHRITYVGELGWEIFMPSDQCQHIFEEIEKAGKDFDLKLCGIHTLDSCRIEKAYRHFGHDITDEDHIIEAGLSFTVDMNKKSFNGKDAISKKMQSGIKKRLFQFKLCDPEPLLFHNEPIIRDGLIVGHLTSGNYGHFLNGSIGLGYVPCVDENISSILRSKFQIEVAGRRWDAEVSIRSMYDPDNIRVRV